MEGAQSPHSSQSQSSQGPPPPALLKTKMCKFFLAKRCSKGRTCPFAHSPDELREQPDLRRTRLCKAFANQGMCEAGLACQYAHSAEELRNPRARAEATTSSGSKAAPAERDAKTAEESPPRGSGTTDDNSPSPPPNNTDRAPERQYSSECSDFSRQLSQQSQAVHEPTGFQITLRRTFLHADLPHQPPSYTELEEQADVSGPAMFRRARSAD
mmetsp:Transcript_34947/g.80487  ORF Transcript_34947/g.80487 Transcript_34947/m.80487 type:complete len:213 (-) Transcript_34947:87-725(-)